jgi:hypothetical protein
MEYFARAADFFAPHEDCIDAVRCVLNSRGFRGVDTSVTPHSSPGFFGFTVTALMRLSSTTISNRPNAGRAFYK